MLRGLYNGQRPPRRLSYWLLLLEVAMRTLLVICLALLSACHSGPQYATDGKPREDFYFIIEEPLQLDPGSTLTPVNETPIRLLADGFELDLHLSRIVQPPSEAQLLIANVDSMIGKTTNTAAISSGAPTIFIGVSEIKGDELELSMEGRFNDNSAAFFNSVLLDFSLPAAEAQALIDELRQPAHQDGQLHYSSSAVTASLQILVPGWNDTEQATATVSLRAKRRDWTP
jgi:hypothetical protein